MKIPAYLKQVRITMPIEMYTRFKSFYPNRHETHNVMLRLLTKHIHECEVALMKGDEMPSLPMLPQITL